MKKFNSITSIFFIVWSLLIVVALITTLTTYKTTEHRYYSEQIQAATLSKKAMEEVRKYRSSLGLKFADHDINDTGLIGPSYTTITTTTGVLNAKLTSTNPDFAAVFIDMFKDAGIKKNDEIGIVMSGSFPGLNISLMAAIEILELKPCIMVMLDSSSYGANERNFTYFQMAEHLYESGIFSNKIDYVSFGGSEDTGNEFTSEDKLYFLNLIERSGINFINKPVFEENIEYRTECIFQKCPKIKLLVNIGSNVVSLGKDDTTYINQNGLVNKVIKQSVIPANRGLIETFLNKDVSVIQMLNIKGIALDYGIPYAPSTMPKIGSSSAYFDEEYSITIPIITLCLSIGSLVFYYVYLRNRKEVN